MLVREFDLKSLDKLLPCPFCGAEAELDWSQDYRAINGAFGKRVVVHCAECDADMGTCVEDVPDIHPNEVIERWNRRADTSALAARLRELEAENARLQSIARGVCEVQLIDAEDIKGRIVFRFSMPGEQFFNPPKFIVDARAALSGEKQ